MTEENRGRWPVPPIVTPRLTLRQSVETDREPLLRMLTDAATRRYLGGALDREDALAAMPETLGLRWGSFVVERTEDAIVIGTCSFSHERGRLEVSYLLLPDYWSGGYASEAVSASLDWVAGQVPNHDVIAVTQAANGPSLRLLHRLGFTEESRFTEWDADQVLLSRALPDQ
jgi:RimJ/RimL family protein N-acetyltransferase